MASTEASRAAANDCTVGNRLHEARIVIEHGGHARLLQHDLGNPDAVRIAVATPGQIATMLVVPARAKQCGIGERFARDAEGSAGLTHADAILNDSRVDL